MGLVPNSGYLERISLAEERILPLADVEGSAPYFSMILIYKGAENWVTDLPVQTIDGTVAPQEQEA